MQEAVVGGHDSSALWPSESKTTSNVERKMEPIAYKTASDADRLLSAVSPFVLMMAQSAPGNVEQMQARVQELQEASEAILQLSDQENRALSDDEIAEVEANAEEAEGLQRRIALRQRVENAAKGTGRRTDPNEAAAAGGGTVGAGQGARNPTRVPAQAGPDKRNYGFRHLGEFAATARRSAMRDEEATNRLMQMNEAVGEDGGFLVPAEFREGIMKIVEGETSLLSYCDRSTTARNSVTQNIDETAPWSTSGIVAYWEGEAQAAPASGGKLGQQTLRLNKLFARVDVTDELLEDAPQLDNYLRVKAPEVMTSVLNLAIIQGNGVGKPLGFMNSNALVTVAAETSQPADTVHHRNVIKMMSRMYAPSWPKSIWLMNQDVWPQLQLMSFRDGSTTPVPAYLPPGGLSASPYGTLLGRPILPLQGMETLGDLGDIALVDMSQYRVITKGNAPRIDTSIHLKFDTDETVYRFIFRIAGAPWWSKAITPRDGSNSLSAFVTLASR